jgi:hypothetical protein
VSDLLRSFRRNAVHVRRALDAGPEATAPLSVERGGYLQDGGRLERYKALATPVRRALNRGDRASLEQALEELRPYHRTDPDWPVVEETWARLRREFESTVALGGAKVPRGRILARWLDAAAFYDSYDHDRAYDRLIEEWGPPAESIGWQLANEVAALVLTVDEAAAAHLDEPVVLPLPARTPPAPPEKAPWWKLFKSKGQRAKGKRR